MNAKQQTTDYKMGRVDGEFSVVQAVANYCERNPNATAREIKAHLDKVMREAKPMQVAQTIAA